MPPNSWRNIKSIFTRCKSISLFECISIKCSELLWYSNVWKKKKHQVNKLLSQATKRLSMCTYEIIVTSKISPKEKESRVFLVQNNKSRTNWQTRLNVMWSLVQNCTSDFRAEKLVRTIFRTSFNNCPRRRIPFMLIGISTNIIRGKFQVKFIGFSFYQDLRISETDSINQSFLQRILLQAKFYFITYVVLHE